MQPLTESRGVKPIRITAITSAGQSGSRRVLCHSLVGAVEVTAFPGPGQTAGLNVGVRVPSSVNECALQAGIEAA